MLRYLAEEECFWTLCMLIENILPIDYYSVMIGVMIDQKLFCKMIAVIMPHLWSFFKKLSLDPSLVSLQWFICLYSYNLQPDVSDEIWDYLLVKGSKVLFKAGLAIISLIEKNILRCTEFRIFSLFYCENSGSYCNARKRTKIIGRCKCANTNDEFR